MNTTIGILSNNLKLSTLFVEKIILNTKAIKDQDHIKMNIFINNNLFNKNERELLTIINKLEKSKIDYLILNFNNKEIYNYLKNNINIPILNKSFSINDNELINQIIKLAGKEVKK